jgi:hypothetical protein
MGRFDSCQLIIRGVLFIVIEVVLVRDPAVAAVFFDGHFLQNSSVDGCVDRWDCCEGKAVRGEWFRICERLEV